jgi:hypothetical protein
MAFYQRATLAFESWSLDTVTNWFNPPLLGGIDIPRYGITEALKMVRDTGDAPVCPGWKPGILLT